MNELIHIDRKELFLEIARYLAAVDLYRAENCEPTGPESRPLAWFRAICSSGKGEDLAAGGTRCRAGGRLLFAWP